MDSEEGVLDTRQQFDDKEYWRQRHVRMGSLQASGLKSVSLKANHYIYRILAEQYLKLLKKMGINEVESILDCGFGDGYFIKFFQEHFPEKKLEGVDISEAAKNKIDFFDKKKLHISDLASFNLKKKFDLVHCFDVLYHVLGEDDYRGALENMAKHSSKYVVLHEKSFRHNPVITSAHVRYRTRELTNQTLNSQGFYLYKEMPTHFFAMRFPIYKLNKIVPGLLYKIDKRIADKYADNRQDALASHTIRVFKKAEA